jgi:hypothetical protein
MALARCKTCGSTQRLKQSYTYSHSVVSPKRILCGAPSCTRLAALIWLTDEEEQRYLQGVRVFRLPNRAVEARVG